MNVAQVLELPALGLSLISITVLPTLLRDMIDKTDSWGNGGDKGRIDPFTEIFDVSPPTEKNCFL